MIGRTNTGGGVSLNFKIVGGTTEPSLPKENMIWVNTDTEITSWIFSATEPENPEEGMVWFTIGTSSPVKFNALKKNGLQVYPQTAKQYVSGAWVDKNAMFYKNNSWNSLRIFISVVEPVKIEQYNSVSYTINEQSIYVKHNGYNSSAAFFAYKADLTDIKVVRVHFINRQHHTYKDPDTGTYVSKSGVGILDVGATSGVLQFWSGSFLASTINSSDGECYLDVSVESISGEKYIWVGFHGVTEDHYSHEFDSIELIR